ncbi:O-antigen ligase family protein [Seonamhaeicola aphaedonensis]|uniref:O-antigen ligase-like membrane protein n=1 Tax=Seonamhaeicola aphaedonensis TaxID=1461338 RepID=A0A3D9HFT2_9FLAO|nr:O-antigen ligase family protein [Seonamhaeicola aphaedonensis]RED48349.1 O-antigen ligase-like membrane protein [Seonamhaeicola aphaedonensis]
MSPRVRKPSTDYYIPQVIFHILLGGVLYFLEPFSKLYFLLVMGYFIIRIVLEPSHKKTQAVFLGCAYFTGAEVLFRMTDGGIAYEASKYLVILFMVLGMFFKGLSGKGYPYFIYLILLIPSILVASGTLSYFVNFRTNIAFVLSGPVCLGIAALFCYDRKVTNKQLLDIIMYLSLPAISMTTYLFLYNPSVKDKLSGAVSNAALSGGFGPNQVSTALGLGMFAIVVRLFMKSPTLFLKVLNVAILGAMTFRAIVTFSRGGVFAAIIVIGAFLYTLFYHASNRMKNQIIVSFVLLVLTSGISWVVSSNQTRGLIDRRYANETSAGIKKKDITTGRLDLFIEEIDGFLSSPFLGIGASRVKDKRVEAYGTELPSHNEIGRLLSEHGVLGIVIILILIFKPIGFRTGNKRNYYFYAFLAFWFATINHSGMRIAAPSLLYAFALLNVVPERVYLKSLTKKKKAVKALEDPVIAT